MAIVLLFTAQEIWLNWRAALVLTTKGVLPPRDHGLRALLALAFLETKGSTSMRASKEEPVRLKHPVLSENYICD